MATEKLNLWDRFFNRYRKEVVAQGTELWTKRRTYAGYTFDTYDYQRNYVEYKIIDRVTGSEKIEREYLN